MISKSEIKLITGLQQKKYRAKHGLFIAEGKKIIADLIKAGVVLHTLFATEDVSELHPNYRSLSETELKRMSALKNSNGVLALFEIPKQLPVKSNGLQLVLDSVRDPGNLGTIIRLCDWFGVEQLICSPDTVDCYNPKVIQATMGSIARVHVVYTDIAEFLTRTNLPIYAAVMEGETIYEIPLPNDAVLVMGNEGNGISEAILALISNKVSIPNFSKNTAAESLNVAMATGILLSEFRRTIGT
ncbi:MAG: RNA methyltransferase [Flavobacteriaceae bacterium]